MDQSWGRHFNHQFHLPKDAKNDQVFDLTFLFLLFFDGEVSLFF